MALRKSIWLLLILTLVACERQIEVPELLERAKRNTSTGDYRAAVTDLKAVLQQEPRNSDARYQLGKIYLHLEDGQAAAKELSLALESNSNPEAILPQLARALLMSQEFERLKDLEMAEEAPDESQALLLAYQGIGNLRSQKKLAKTQIERALALNDSRVEPALAMAMWHQLSGDGQSARVWIDKAKGRKGDIASVWSFLGYLESLSGNYQASIDAYSKAIELKENANREKLSRSLVLLQIGDMEAVKRDLGSLDGAWRGHPQVNFIRGVMSYENKEYHEAINHLDKVLTLHDDYLPALLYSGSAHYLIKNYDIASDYLNKYLSLDKSSVEAKKALASTSIFLGDPVSAERIVTEVLDDSPEDIFALEVLADSLRVRGDLERLVEVRQLLRKLEPDSESRKLQLAQAMRLAGQRGAAVEVYQSVLQSNPNSSPAYQGLAATYSSAGEFSKAFDVAKEFKLRRSGEVEPYLLEGLLRIDTNELDLANEAFLNVISMEKGNLAAHNGLAAVLAAKGDFEQAIGVYREALKLDPGSLQAQMNLAALQVKLGRDEDAVQTLEATLGDNPAHEGLLLELSKLYMGLGKHKDTVILLEHRNLDRNATLLTTLAEAKLQLGDLTGAETAMIRYVSKFPDDSHAHYSLAMLQAGQGNQRGYKLGIESAYELNPDDEKVLLERIDINLEQQALQLAEQDLLKLEAVVGNRPDVQVLRARLFEAGGNLKQALNLYETAYKSAENNHTLIRWTNALWKGGQTEKVLELQRQWLIQNPHDGVVLFDLANRYWMLGEEGEAVSHFSKLVEQGQRNPLIYNNLAWLLRNNAPEKAEAFGAKAVELAPLSPAFQDTYAVALMNSGKLLKAKDVIERAKNLDAQSTAISYHRALILEKSGDARGAKRELMALLGRQEEFTQRKDAEALLRKLEGI